MTKKLLFALLLLIGLNGKTRAENGYRLWLHYDKINNKSVYNGYRGQLSQLIFPGKSEILKAAREELHAGLSGLLNLKLTSSISASTNGALIIGTPASSKLIASMPLAASLKSVAAEGFVIRSINHQGKMATVIAANSDAGVLYGVFNFLKLLQTNTNISKLNVLESPKTKLRLLNHWDNLNRSVERGYAGLSLWDWNALPDLNNPRYKDYARANASIGINGTVLTNVNADAKILTKAYLEKAAALANVFRSYHLKVYLTARFSAPIEIGGLKTADPLDPAVQKWWKDKVNEIYTYIPDFGGLLVKANSEGQPGPQNYGRTHADGANMFADALAPHGGVVMWRAFVYDHNVPDDRAKQAYTEFKPLDGKFRSNVIVQIKNGPIDFQPREPFSPLFGAMPKTPEMMEFQVTMEYLGQSTHLVYLGTSFKESLDADTYSKGKGSTVARVVDGSLEGHSISGMAGVANIGTDSSWCGNQFNPANWYAYGRLAWNHQQRTEDIAADWLKMTFSNDESFVGPVKKLMMESRENTVNYIAPLGLHHIMGVSTHYGPGPWINNAGRADWNSTYYHKADSLGIGFNRSSTGTNAVSQYFPPVKSMFDAVSTTPEEYLLWFHHLPWSYRMKSGNTLWNELVAHYYGGVVAVQQSRLTWKKMEGKIDAERFKSVTQLLARQAAEAKWYRDADLLYFQTFSRMPIPEQYEKPEYTLETYMNPNFIPMPEVPVPKII
jgi:alpha-glucuronidase